MKLYLKFYGFSLILLLVDSFLILGPTENTSALVEKGFLLPLGHLLMHPLGNIRTQAAWTSLFSFNKSEI